jgi:prolyl-tRNA synthetase
MRISKTFWTTLRDAPAGVELPGQQLLLRAGLVRAPAPTLWNFLPLGQTAWERLLARTVALLEGEGATRAALPPCRPAESSSGQAGRWQWGAEPAWAVWDIGERDIRSYKQLPALFYDVAPRAIAHPNARAGLLGAAVTRRLTVCGLYANPASALAANARLRQTLLACLQELGLSCRPALAGAGDARSWLYPHPLGELTAFQCPSCNFVALPGATAIAPPPADTADMLSTQEVETPDCTTIAGLAGFLGVPAARTMKVVFYTTDDRQVVCAVIRGDLAIDEEKLTRALGGRGFAPSSDSDVRWIGSVPGYGSPIGLRNVVVLADPSVMAARNLVAGANREPFHLLNVTPSRDFKVDRVVDLRAAQAGDPCPSCGASLSAQPACELGSDAAFAAESSGHPEATYLDEAGKSQYLTLSLLSLDLDRVFAALAETHLDADGLRWPAAVAPADVYLLGIKLKGDPSVAAACERAIERIERAGLTVIFDDRDERPGVAFKDADLLGVPLRLTISQRSLEAGGIEVKWRAEADKSIAPEDQLDPLLARLRSA